MNLMKWILPLVLLAACSNNNQPNQPPNVQPDYNSTELEARDQAVVMDNAGNPVSDATVHIGMLVTQTNANGVFEVPDSWTHEEAVTIIKDGFVKTSYLKQKPQGQIFEIRLRKPTVRNEVKGVITGFGNLPKDGFIDFGLSIASLDQQNALNFDISQLISEEVDVVEIMGQQLRIPTNVFVPKQKESYGFIPVTIEKAFYRLFFDFNGTFKVQTNRGKFDFKKVADKLKAGKSFFEVVNDFEFLSLGTKTVSVTQPNVALDMDASQKKLVPRIPFGLTSPASGMLFGISMQEEDGKLLPVDIKLREGTTQMLALSESAQRGTVLLVNADKNQISKDTASLSASMSTALVDSEKISQGFLLERIAAPEVTSDGIKLSKPLLKGNLKGFATYAALSEVKTERFDNFALERADVTWEIYSPDWIDNIALPGVRDVRANQRWQVVFYGIDSVANKQFNGPKTLNQATHAVQNSVIF